MSSLFEPIRFGDMQIKNRFVHSATYEAMARETGEVTDQLINRYKNIAKGKAGLIIPGLMHVHSLGRGNKYATGIHSDLMIPGLTKLTDAVHQEDGKIVFQLVHAGRQTTKANIGQTPLGPSSKGRDPINFVKPKEMDEDQIQEVVRAFVSAAQRAVEAGADGIQLHAAHGYLINQFISPFFNHRKDGWGGSDINRFRFLKEIFSAVRKAVPEGMPVLVKLSTNDFTPTEGVIPSQAAKYAGWLAEMGVSGVETSCGSTLYSFMNLCRGDVPEKELVAGLPIWKRPAGKLLVSRMSGKFGFEGGYNIPAAKMIKPVIGNIPLLLVGGMRKEAEMGQALEEGYADCISMSRPFIREPFIVKKIWEGKVEQAACRSCNRCFAAASRDIPVKCYNSKSLPRARS